MRALEPVAKDFTPSLSRGRGRSLLSFAVLALAAAACTKDSAPAPVANDRTLEKLRAEVDRANRGESIGHAPTDTEDPNARLAGLATQDFKSRTLALPEPNETKMLGPLAVKLNSLQAMHSVKAGKLELTSTDAFLQVKLLAQNTDDFPNSMDFSLAYVTDASGNVYGLVEDAQRGAGTKQLQRAWGAHEREEQVLFFEVPPQTIGHELKLVLPAGVSSSASSDLKLPLD